MLFHHMNNILRETALSLSGVKRMSVDCLCWLMYIAQLYVFWITDHEQGTQTGDENIF